MTSQKQTVRLKVSPEMARIISPSAPREAKLNAARGALPLPGKDLAPTLFFLCHAGDAEIRENALESFRRLSSGAVRLALENSDLPPQFLDFVSRFHLADPAIVSALLEHPALSDATLLHLAEKASAGVLPLLIANEQCLQNPEIVDTLLANPEITETEQSQLLSSAVADGAEPQESTTDDQTESGDEEESELSTDSEAAEEDLNLSKYQLALEMGVSEKIKTALTGDKEWRSIFLKDPNKLVSSAVLKNPRITDGEVLTVAKNKSSNDELIRLIILNREWVKNYEIKRALVLHPRTPLPKALRYMEILTEKDLKSLAKSRGVSQVIVNNARRMVLLKQKKR